MPIHRLTVSIKILAQASGREARPYLEALTRSVRRRMEYRPPGLRMVRQKIVRLPVAPPTSLLRRSFRLRASQGLEMPIREGPGPPLVIEIRAVPIPDAPVREVIMSFPVN